MASRPTPSPARDTRTTLDMAPWMKIATAEKGVTEDENVAFSSMLYHSAVRQNVQARQTPLSLLDRPRVQRSYLLEDLTHPAKVMARSNSQIAKYFDGVNYAGGLSATDKHVSRTTTGWMITAWCAAFVNYCLKQAGAPYLGRARAADWLTFGTPLPVPVYGCVTILRPRSGTDQSSGHVAFFVRQKAKRIVLLGGNQGRIGRVSEMEEDETLVEGYRWPTEFNYLLLDRSSRLV